MTAPSGFARLTGLGPALDLPQGAVLAARLTGAELVGHAR
ncbi:hypothetical protein SAMN05443377_10771 [Propionibacterium cyclohexanicum]|uniref:Uncharacterized protein n=1 Tax=Propionibacterium cyclohexanicum TaxID=64702 RepID=A0A1H9RH70_9ACTN|nr:hypothetical protein SAMN05443377_10771 [Propionibacterium cyclohexanicum]